MADFTDILSIENIVFCFGISMLTKAIRFLVQKIWKDAESNMVYRDIFLPVLPILIGAGLAFTHFPIMAAFAVNKTAKVFFGACAGALSAHVYAMFKKITSQDKPE